MGDRILDSGCSEVERPCAQQVHLSTAHRLRESGGITLSDFGFRVLDAGCEVKLFAETSVHNKSTFPPPSAC